MKTIIQKFIFIIAVVIVSLSANAQNTKAVNEGVLKSKVSNSVQQFQSILSNELETLKRLLKYSPSVLESESLTEDLDIEFENIEKELEYKIKFCPANENFTMTELYSDRVIDINELESAARFFPSEMDCYSTRFSSEIERLFAELAVNAKYSPEDFKI